MAKGFSAGIAAGAAGTTALNVVTYLDMAFRGRGTSKTPQDTVKALAGRLGVRIPGDDETQTNRVAGLGPLLGVVAGLGVGVAFGVARSAGWRPSLLLGAVAAGVGAMAATGAPMARLGVTDPKSWAPQDWISDAVPHLAYGLVSAAVIRGLDPDHPKEVHP